MPRFDQHCKTCEWVGTIITDPFSHPPCPSCGGATERIYLGGYMVVGDDIPGGRWVENLDTKPVYVESKSQLKREMEVRGLTESVRHVGVPGSDKSPHTTRHV
jgi:hypothetical protein